MPESMSSLAAEAWPWLSLAGLGAFHGLNPAMGWLFAVALGLHRKDRGIVLLALLPIAAGHAVSVAAIAAVFLAIGTHVDQGAVRVGAGAVLIAWALYHWRYGHRHRVRFGMQTALGGLAVWSFLMATAHGAGLMLWPALAPICFGGANVTAGAGDAFAAGLGAVGVHTAAMLAVTGAIAIAVYAWIGVEILRSAWLNLDLAWTLALVAAGAWLMAGI
jgi:hypothetical protein